ncbi:transglutaminase-like domain-containing protein [Pseudodesulfovibrio sp. zrk46]|uniref:transglutaminase-like domain-containing protein n=1 Tax=Pseudodesulfovibrio sp. zrk46 TaxID=2725288 RepID=UPI001448E699|nr:transglutaminase-like domain-containing protein [Pseudodesulfovibrio sp. zrk46]QJB57280.1 transglutaminase domain-containing protein [Pseudodesulfovibrio sp. zrk46]
MRGQTILSALLLALLLCTPVLAGSAAGTVTMQFDMSEQPKGEEIKLWVPYPVSDENQTITNVRINGDYIESAVYTDNKFQVPMLFMRWDKNNAAKTATFSYDVERKEITRDKLPTTEAQWDPRDYKIYLEPTRLGPIDGQVKALADSITKGETTIVDKAKAIYDWMCENTYRNPETRGCGEGDVCLLIKDPGGKCGDLSSLFIALLRASGVPSREVFGIRQAKNMQQDITKWQHCWAEFYVPGYGWVPADPADVRKMMLKYDLKLTDSKTDEYRDYYWGGIDPYRIKLSEGRDLKLTPAQNGAPVNYLMYPYAQVGGKTLDWLDPEHFKYTINYTQKTQLSQK